MNKCAEMDDLSGRDLTVVPLSHTKIPYGVFEIAKVDPYIASEIPESRPGLAITAYVKYYCGNPGLRSPLDFAKNFCYNVKKRHF